MVPIGVFDALEYMGIEFFDKRRLLFRKNIFNSLATHQLGKLSEIHL